MSKLLRLYPTGTCFDDVMGYVEGLLKYEPEHSTLEDYKLCHGILEAPDGSGEEYSHAWIEHEERQVIMSGKLDSGIIVYASGPLDNFYERSRPRDVTKYTIAQVIELNLASGHFGPWEERYRALCPNVAGAKAMSMQDVSGVHRV